MNNKEIEQSARDRFGIPRKLEDISEEELRQAITECKTFAGVRLRLGLGSEWCTNEDVKKRCAEAGIDCGQLESKKASRWEMYSIKELEKFANSSRTISELCEKIGHMSVGHARDLLLPMINENETIKQLFIDNEYKKKPRRLSPKLEQFSISEITQIVKESSTYREIADKLEYKNTSSASNLCKRLDLDTFHIDNRNQILLLSKMKEGNELTGATIIRAISYVRDVSHCERCGIDEYNGKPISMQAHHKNGIHNDNRIENIAILCPTCHAIVENRAMKDGKLSSHKKSVIERDGWKCSYCGVEEINGDPVPLELHHKNGDHQDQNLKNLTLLCPNCHSQSENWNGRNERKHISDDEFVAALKQSATMNAAAYKLGVRAGKAFYKRAKRLVSKYDINLHLEKRNLTQRQIGQIISLLETETPLMEISAITSVGKGTISKINQGNHMLCPDDRAYPIRTKHPHVSNTSGILDSFSHIPNRCPICGRIINKRSTYCSQCAHNMQRKVERPSRETLMELLYEENIANIAKKYNVSHTAIKKWCQYYKLPYRYHDRLKFFEQGVNYDAIFENDDSTLPEKSIVKLYNETKNLSLVASTYHCSDETIKRICSKYGVKVLNNKDKNAFSVIGIHKETGEIVEFASQYAARDWVLANHLGTSSRGILRHIKEIIKGDSNRKTAYGYYWKSADALENLLEE